MKWEKPNGLSIKDQQKIRWDGVITNVGPINMIWFLLMGCNGCIWWISHSFFYAF